MSRPESPFSDIDHDYMQVALQLAEQAERHDEVPVGAIIVLDDHIIGRGHNQTITHSDPSAHAEIIALRDAGNHQKNYRLPGATMYVTLEPCAMCAGALVHARIARLIYAASDPKTGAAQSVFQITSDSRLNHQINVESGLLADDSRRLLQHFFAKKRRQKTLVS